MPLKKKEKILSLMNSLTSEGIDPQELALEIQNLDPKKKSAVLAALQQVQQGQREFMESVKKQITFTKRVPSAKTILKPKTDINR